MNFLCLLKLPGKQYHYNLTNGKLVYCFHGKSIFPTKLIKRRFPKPLFSHGTQEFIRKHSVHIKYLWETHWINKQESLSAGSERETCFPNSEMPKNFHACPRINKSSERHPWVPYYSPPLFPTIANKRKWGHREGRSRSSPWDICPRKLLLDEQKSFFWRKSVPRDVRMQANLGLMF